MIVVPGQRPRTVAIAPQAGSEAPIGLIKKDSTMELSWPKAERLWHAVTYWTQSLPKASRTSSHATLLFRQPYILQTPVQRF